MRLLSKLWSMRIEADYAGIAAELAALVVREESWPQDFVRVAQIRWRMAALRAETAALRILRRLKLAALRVKIAMVRIKTVVLRMLLWPRWPGWAVNP